MSQKNVHLVNKKAVGIHLVASAICETTEEIDVMYGEYTTAGYEGQMIRQDAVYENKRSKGLLKRYSCHPVGSKTARNAIHFCWDKNY